MNYLCLNIRGAGEEEKARWVRRLVAENRVSFMAIQETQMADMSDRLVSRFWGNTHSDMFFVNASGRSGGLFSIWNTHALFDTSVVAGNHFIIVTGNIHGVEGKINICNVSAPNNATRRKQLWSELLEIRCQLSGPVIFLGDFNEVRYIEERRNSNFDAGGPLAFNNFIREAGLMEYTLAGGNFTYISDDGFKLSKLDRVLVCDSFMSLWPHANLKALCRELSDHRPLVLSCELVDFGSIPFKFFSYWLEVEGFSELIKGVIREGVRSMEGDKALVELFKKLKAKIKLWRESVKALEGAKKALAIQELEKIEKIAEVRDLVKSEKDNRVSWKQNIKMMEKRRNYELRQKSKTNWVQYGMKIPFFSTSGYTIAKWLKG
ncbi:uncharacterized protein LOC110931406 [Helianthus annuus]|uniref:uncharacterized protein LOC110931406 n=1 Tax=Helianthus annuus TaxID=4232 RepID=UPI000B8FE291|nr:uncharacterized protein LOC110931406 [Helianthus annuus]